MICKNCGSKIADNATECPFCLIDIDDVYRNQVRQEQMKLVDNARRAEEVAARKAGNIRKNAHKAQLIAARKEAAARKAEAKAAHKMEIARRAQAKAATKLEEARRAAATAARLVEELRRADAAVAQKSQYARNAQAAEMLPPQRGYSVPLTPYGSQMTPPIPKPEYEQETGQLLQAYPYEEK